MGHAAYTPVLTHYRIYDDDGGEAASTPLENEDTSHDFNVDAGNITFHLRFNEDEQGGDTNSNSNRVIQLRYDKNSTGATNVTAISNDIQAAGSGSQLTDDDATTNRATNGITDGSGTFIAGEQEEGDGSVTCTDQLTAGNFTEFVFAVTIVAADVANGDSITFDYTDDGTAVTVNSTPTITITKSAAPVERSVIDGVFVNDDRISLLLKNIVNQFSLGDSIKESRDLVKSEIDELLLSSNEELGFKLVRTLTDELLLDDSVRKEIGRVLIDRLLFSDSATAQLGLLPAGGPFRPNWAIVGRAKGNIAPKPPFTINRDSVFAYDLNQLRTSFLGRDRFENLVKPSPDVTLTSGGPSFTPRPDTQNYAWEFPSADAHISLNDVFGIPASGEAFTCAFWWAPIVHRTQTIGLVGERTGGILLNGFSSGIYRWNITSLGNTSGTAYSLNELALSVITYDGTTAQEYKNGKISAVSISGANTVTANGIWIGNQRNVDPVNGYIALFGLWGYAFSADTVEAFYDPSTRWDIIYELGKRKFFGFASVAAGGQIVNRSALDSLFMFDRRRSIQESKYILNLLLDDQRFSKQENIQFDNLLLDDRRRSIVEATKLDTLYINDFQSVSQDKIFVDYFVLSDTVQSIKLAIRSISDGIIINDDTRRKIVLYFLENLFLLDTVNTSVVGPGQIIVNRSALDNLLFKDDPMRILEKIDIDEFFFFDYPIREQLKLDSDDVFLSDKLIKEQLILYKDDLLIDDNNLPIVNRVRDIIDTLLISDTTAKAFGITKEDRIIFNEFIIKLTALIVSENVLLRDSSTATLIQSVVTALVWAKISSADPFNIVVSAQDNFLMVRNDFRDLLQLDIGAIYLPEMQEE